jgi:hypothetical protein
VSLNRSTSLSRTCRNGWTQASSKEIQEIPVRREIPVTQVQSEIPGRGVTQGKPVLQEIPGLKVKPEKRVILVIQALLETLGIQEQPEKLERLVKPVRLDNVAASS